VVARCSTVLLRSVNEVLNGVIANSNEPGSMIARRTLPGLVKTAPRLVESVAVPIVVYYLLTDYRRFIAFVHCALAPRRLEGFDSHGATALLAGTSTTRVPAIVLSAM
jgi:hypothetical protein